MSDRDRGQSDNGGEERQPDRPERGGYVPPDLSDPPAPPESEPEGDED